MVRVIPLIVGTGFDVGEVTSAVTYFLVQAIGSFLILIPGVIAKLGLAPVHL